jgi:hypothetical protein
MEGKEFFTAFLVGASLLGWALLFRTLFAAREGVGWILKAALVGGMALIATQKVLLGIHRDQQDVTTGSLIAAGIAVALTPKRRRYISARVKRKVIANYERKTGRKYNSRQMDLDHVWPFSKGGSNTVDNLRVISRVENRRKGARKPRLKDWLKRWERTMPKSGAKARRWRLRM